MRPTPFLLTVEVGGMPIHQHMKGENDSTLEDFNARPVRREGATFIDGGRTKLTLVDRETSDDE